MADRASARRSAGRDAPGYDDDRDLNRLEDVQSVLYEALHRGEARDFRRHGEYAVIDPKKYGRSWRFRRSIITLPVLAILALTATPRDAAAQGLTRLGALRRRMGARTPTLADSPLFRRASE